MNVHSPLAFCFVYLIAFIVIDCCHLNVHCILILYNKNIKKQQQHKQQTKTFQPCEVYLGGKLRAKKAPEIRRVCLTDNI